MTGEQGRLDPTERTVRHVWAASAGRCALCKRSVLTNELVGRAVPIGEMAHIVGHSSTSPRGQSELTSEERREADNFILLCRNCHKAVDDEKAQGLYSVDRLLTLKREHEQGVSTVTEIDPNQRATIIRLVGEVRGVHPSLTYSSALRALVDVGLFPQMLPGASTAEADIDLSTRPRAGTPEYYQTCADEIDERLKPVNDAVRRGTIERLAVFAFARIPLLVHLGARLDDKVSTMVFQRKRSDDANPWSWPKAAPSVPAFHFDLVEGDPEAAFAALVVNMSGTIQMQDLPSDVMDSSAVYTIAPVPPVETGPTVIDSPAALQAFEATARAFLAHVEANHGRIPQIDLFAAIPISPAVTLGRVLMPSVSPAWSVWDRDERGAFFKALEVRR